MPEAAVKSAPGRPALVTEFLAAAGWADAARRPLAVDASARRYERLRCAGRSAVLMDAPPPEDVRRFLAVGRLLREHGFSAPAVLAADEAAGLLLLEDLGDDTFARLLARGADEHELYALAVDVLVALRRRVPAGAIEAVPAFDDARILEGLARFFDWCWPALFGAAAGEPARTGFAAAWRQVLPLRHGVPDGLALFDFHVDNLMRLPGRPGVAACGLLDFQDAVRAPLPHDLMCLVEDARRDVAPALGAAMRARYLAAFPELDPGAFDLSWAVLGAQRHARTLGTFARLWRRDGKAGYLTHVPRLWRHLERSLAHPALGPVRDWFDRHVPPRVRRTPLGPRSAS